MGNKLLLLLLLFLEQLFCVAIKKLNAQLELQDLF